MPTIHELAKEAYASFERAERADASGTYYTRVRTRDDAPKWVSDLVHEAHGAMLPDDWRYDCICEALGAIDEAGADADTDDLAGEFADTDDLAGEFADGVDVYTSDLLTWLGSHGWRTGYCDDAARELGAEGGTIDQRIMLGQFAERYEVFGLVLEFLRERAEAGA